MAETSIIGKIYTAPYIQARTIAFVNSNPDTITDSDSGFVKALFTAEKDIVVATESTLNDGIYTIDVGGVSAGTLTLDAGDSLTNESAGQLVTIVQKAPGDVKAGIRGVTFNQSIDIAETTSYDDGEWKTFIPELKEWDATLDKIWITKTGGQSIFAIPHLYRFFAKYFASPSLGDVAVYWEGVGIATGITTNLAKGRLITEPITIKGIGSLVMKTQSSAW